jgi:hypothetical protein
MTMLALVTALSARGEMREWTFADGSSRKAEFISVVGNKVVLALPSGKQQRIPLAGFSEEDILFIELNSPPNIDFRFSKSSKARVYPDSWNMNNRPQSFYFTFKMDVFRTITSSYRHGLTAEFFVIGKEIHGKKNILLDYQKEEFHFTDDSNEGIEMTSRVIELVRFPMGTQIRGEEYDGYLLTVTDARGEIIAYKATDENWFNHIDNLRQVPIGKIFDDSCNRCMPTRPKKFY